MYVRCFTKTGSWNNWLDVKERLAIAIKEIVEKNGASFAFPSQSIYVCLLYTSPSPRDKRQSRMPSSA